MDRISWFPVPEESELPEDLQGLFRAARERIGFVPNVFRTYSYRPERLSAWFAHFRMLHEETPGLSAAEREMIAVVVSVANRCAYCIAAHSAALRKLTKDPALAEAVAADPTTAPLEPRVRAMLDYALKLTLHPTTMSEADVELLREAGWTDEDVMDVAEVTGMFNLTNRMASGLGWEPNPEYDALGR